MVVEELKELIPTERKMLRVMSDVALSDRISSLGVAERLSVWSIEM